MLNPRESVDMPWESQGRNADLESTLLTVHKSTKVDIDSGSTGTTLAWVAPDGPLGPIYMAQLRKGEFRWMPLFPRASSAKSKDPPAPIAARVHTHTKPARAHGRRVTPLASSVATMVVCAS